MTRGGRDPGHACAESRAISRQSTPSSRGARGRSRRTGRAARAPRSDGRPPVPHPRRRVVRGPGRRRGDVQPPLPRRLLDGWNAARHCEQPGRLHDRSRRGALDPLLERPRQGLRRADRARQRRRPGGRGVRDPAALAYREEFGHDIVVDLVGYRRFGHNEQDEAAYTQPLHGRAHRRSRSAVRRVYAARLVADGSCCPTSRRTTLEQTLEVLRAAHDELGPASPRPCRRRRSPDADRHGRRRADRRVRRPPRPARRAVAAGARRVRGNAKLARQLERRRESLREGGIDWGHAEALAFATLLEDGIPIRPSGQDTERGTFSHRHAVLHDPRTGETFTPLQALPAASASFEIYNSPLSEYAALAFEHGYSIAAPDALVLWEAQFGDFINGAQIVVDQFIVSGRSKWGQTSRLALLLPHGYEGNGPEHSSARLERFLQLAAQDNIRVVNCTTAAQFFHLLRRQALDATARPLVVMTPKGLLRLREATSSLEDLALGSFQPVLDDVAAEHSVDPAVVLCSGKVYYDIVGHDLRAPTRAVAVARLEQLYPFPLDAIASLVSSYPAAPARSSGRRRSRRTWARGGRCATGWRKRPRARRPHARPVRRAGPGVRARARATRRSITTSRIGSCARRSASGPRLKR